MKMKHSFFITLGIITAVSLFGSEPSHGGFNLFGDNSKATIIAKSLSSMPNDAAVVIKASAYHMTGRRMPFRVEFSEPAALSLKQYPLVEPNFQLSSAVLYQFLKTDNGSKRRILTDITFTDTLGRKSMCELTADYELSSTTTTIVKASVTEISPKEPAASFFILPADRLPFAMASPPVRFQTLYETVTKQAATPDESAGNSNLENDWVMIVFFMDRLPLSADIQIGISTSSVGLDAYTKSSRYLDYNGWRVGVAAGRFVRGENGSKGKLYLKAVYSPGKEAGAIRLPKLIGVYPLTR